MVQCTLWQPLMADRNEPAALDGGRHKAGGEKESERERKKGGFLQAAH